MTIYFQFNKAQIVTVQQPLLHHTQPMSCSQDTNCFPWAKQIFACFQEAVCSHLQHHLLGIGAFVAHFKHQYTKHSIAHRAGSPPPPPKEQHGPSQITSEMFLGATEIFHVSHTRQTTTSLNQVLGATSLEGKAKLMPANQVLPAMCVDWFLSFPQQTPAPIGLLKTDHHTSNQSRSSCLLIPQPPQISEMMVVPGAISTFSLRAELCCSSPAQSLVGFTTTPLRLLGRKHVPLEPV